MIESKRKTSFSISSGDAHQQCQTVEILGVPVGIYTRATLNAYFKKLLQDKKRGWISYINVHTVNLAQENPWFKEYLRQSLLSYCDGVGVKLGAALLGKKLPERIVFTDWIYDVLEITSTAGIKVFLLGATDVVLEKAVRRITGIFPSLSIVGTQQGYFEESEEDKIIQRINDSGAEVLIVGMGMPRQEQWVQRNFHSIESRIIFSAGSCLDFVAGTKRRCPLWMGKVGLEWLFRLFLEPRRLWKRYLIGNPQYIFRVLRKSLHFTIV